MVSFRRESLIGKIFLRLFDISRLEYRNFIWSIILCFTVSWYLMWFILSLWELCCKIKSTYLIFYFLQFWIWWKVSTHIEWFQLYMYWVTSFTWVNLVVWLLHIFFFYSEVDCSRTENMQCCWRKRFVIL